MTHPLHAFSPISLLTHFTLMFQQVEDDWSTPIHTYHAKQSTPTKQSTPVSLSSHGSLTRYSLNLSPHGLHGTPHMRERMTDFSFMNSTLYNQTFAVCMRYTS